MAIGSCVVDTNILLRCALLPSAVSRRPVYLALKLPIASVLCYYQALRSIL